MSKVKIDPPKKKRGKLPQPPNPEQVASHNTSKPAPGKKAQIHFDVSAGEKRELKILAAEHDMKMVEIFREAIDLWKEHHGKA